MALLEKNLVVKKSTLPGAGKGLFTKKIIPKGARIAEYKGKISTWKEVDHHDGLNAYIFYINRNHVIDGSKHKKVFARFANDAKGSEKRTGLINNCKYVVDGLRVFLESKKEISANEEILAGYGKEYWDIIMVNKKKAAKKNKKLKRAKSK
jgi:SET domain-containing protein